MVNKKFVVSVQLKYGESEYSEARLCPDHDFYAPEIEDWIFFGNINLAYYI